MSESVSPELQAAFNRIFADYMAEKSGSASQTTWECEDGWLVAYTTTRVEGGPHDGKFVTMAYKPIGKGARTNPAHWERVYIRAFSKRKLARARADHLFYQHSQNRAEKHGRTT